MILKIVIEGELEVQPGEPGWTDCRTEEDVVAACQKMLDDGDVSEVDLLEWMEVSCETRFEVGHA